jgi:Recombinase.
MFRADFLDFTSKSVEVWPNLPLRRQGYTFAAIATELNSGNLPTACGGLWYPTTVRNILQRLA